MELIVNLNPCPGKDSFLLLDRSLENHSKGPAEGCRGPPIVSHLQSTGVLILLGLDSLDSLSFPPMGRWPSTVILLGQSI